MCFNKQKMYENNFDYNQVKQLYQIGYCFSKKINSFVEYNNKLGFWMPIPSENLKLRWGNASLKAMKQYESFMFKTTRKVQNKFYFLQQNGKVIEINIDNKAIVIKELDEPTQNYKYLHDLVKKCNFLQQDIVDFNLNEAEISKMNIILKNSSFLNKNYLDLYREVCPKIVKFVEEFSSYYHDKNLNLEITKNVLNWLILLSFKSQSPEARELSYAQVCKMFCLSGLARSGKSQLTNLFNLISLNSGMSSELSRLDDRFETSSWIESPLLLFDESTSELNELSIKSVSSLKRITGQDEIPIEIKFGPRTSKRFFGLIVLCGQQKIKIPENDFIAISRRLSSMIVCSRTLKNPITNFSQNILKDEILAFTILTLFLTNIKVENTHCMTDTVQLTYNKDFLCNLVRQIDAFSLERSLLKTITKNDYNKFLVNQVDPLLLFVMQFNNSNSKHESILIPHLAILFIRHLLCLKNSKFLIHNLSLFQNNLIQIFRGRNFNVWRDINILTTNKINFSGNLKDVGLEGIADLLINVVDRSKNSLEINEWSNFADRIESRVNYAKILGLNVANFDLFRKIADSEEEINNQTQYIQTSLLAIKDLQPHDRTAKLLLNSLECLNNVDLLSTISLRPYESLIITNKENLEALNADIEVEAKEEFKSRLLGPKDEVLLKKYKACLFDIKKFKKENNKKEVNKIRSKINYYKKTLEKKGFSIKDVTKWNV